MKKSIRQRLYAPILWALWPFAAGLYLARVYAIGPSIEMVLVGLALVAGCVVCSFLPVRREFTRHLIRLSVACGFLILGLFWWSWRVPAPPTWLSEAAPREATLTLRVERVFGSGAYNERVLGLAQVENAPWYFEGLEDCGLYFSLRPPKGAEAVLAGSRYEVRGLVRPLVSGERGSFRNYLHSNGYSAELVRGRFLSLVEEPSAFRRLCQAAYARLSDTLNEGGERFPNTAGLLPAMLLGQKASINEDQEARLMQTGTMHLFAISGLHIVAVALVLRRLFGWCRIHGSLGIVLTLFLVFLYVEITGGAPSSWRAFLMLLLYWLSRLLWRQYGPLAAWSAAALGVLLWSPISLWHLGFQLSYLVVAGILLYGLPLQIWVEQKWPPFPFLPRADWRWRERIMASVRSFLVGALAISSGAFLASTPLIALHFGLYTPGGILLNLALVPAASLVVFFGVGSMLCAMAHATALATLLNFPAQLALTAMIGVIEYWATLPLLFHSVDFSHSVLWKSLLVLNTLALFLGPKISRLGYAEIRWLLPWALCTWPIALSALCSSMPLW